MDLWLWIALALVAGAIVGAALATLLVRRSRGDQETVRSVRAELDEYRLEVKEHFVQTAELVNNLTRSYKAVYDHLESGAYGLVGNEALHKELGNVEEEPIKLEYIGSRSPAESLGSGEHLEDGQASEEAPPSLATETYESEQRHDDFPDAGEEEAVAEAGEEEVRAREGPETVR